MTSNPALERIDKIHAIVKRAKATLGLEPFDFMSYCMDIEAADCNIPLDLDRFLSGENFDFAHDFFGILRHINRSTGVMGGCFVPRFALPEYAPRPEGLPVRPAWLV